MVHRMLSDDLPRQINPDGEYIRVMYAREIKERDSLNIANTASALRRRVIAELARENGHSSKAK